MIPTPLQHGQLTASIILTQNLRGFFCFHAIHVSRERLMGSRSQNNILHCTMQDNTLKSYSSSKRENMFQRCHQKRR